MGDELVATGVTGTDGRIAELASQLEPGSYRLVFHPETDFFARVELEVALGDGHPHVPSSSPPIRARPTAAAERTTSSLSSSRGIRASSPSSHARDPLGQARKVLADAPEDEQIEALAGHPRIGQRVNISRRPHRSKAPTRIPPSSPRSRG